VEGVQDYEKIRILREEFTKANNREGLSKLEKMLSPFDINAPKDTPAGDLLKTAKATLNSL
jgi:hypothetical protein